MYSCQSVLIAHECMHNEPVNSRLGPQLAMLLPSQTSDFYAEALKLVYCAVPSKIELAPYTQQHREYGTLAEILAHKGLPPRYQRMSFKKSQRLVSFPTSHAPLFSHFSARK